MSDQTTPKNPDAPASVSRRDFIATGAIAAAAFTIVPRHVLGQGMTPPSDLVNIAVVGINGQGGVNTQAVMSQNIVAICDVDRTRADNAAAEFGIRAYHDVATMLAAEGLDMVSVATAGTENGSHHCVPTIQALEAGVHVLVEKPISNDIVEAVRMVDTAVETIRDELEERVRSFESSIWVLRGAQRSRWARTMAPIAAVMSSAEVSSKGQR